MPVWQPPFAGLCCWSHLELGRRLERCWNRENESIRNREWLQEAEFELRHRPAEARRSKKAIASRLKKGKRSASEPTQCARTTFMPRDAVSYQLFRTNGFRFLRIRIGRITDAT